jgi:hypothetical protein
MRIERSARHCLFWIVATGIIFNIQASVAQKTSEEKTMDLIQQMQVLQTTRVATVVIVPPDWAFRVRLNEGSLKDVGCTFVTRDPSRIANLIEVLKRTDVRITDSIYSSWEPREGIFLSLSDASEVHFLFDQHFAGRNIVQGTLTHLPHFDNSYVTGNESLPRELIRWAADTGPPTSKYHHHQIE